MVDSATKRRVTQIHMDAIAKDSGPVYGVRLIRELPIGGMFQAMPSRRDLEQVREISERTVAGYEVLLQHYREQCEKMKKLEESWQDGHSVQELRHREEVGRLKELIRGVIAGNWCVTDLQEAIGDLSR